MTTITQEEKATSGQVKQIKRFIQDAVDKIATEVGNIDFTKPGAQRVIENGDDLVQKLQETAVAVLRDLSKTNKYKDEEVSSEYGYLSGYKAPIGIVQQSNVLRELFPGIGFVNQDLLTKIENGEIELPKDAEGWFTIPNWKKNPKIFGKTYGEAVQVVFDKIKKTRNGSFYNYWDGQLGPEYLRMHSRTEAILEEIVKEQEDADILIIPAQFGLTHRGRSVRRAREVFTFNEFGLTTFAIGCMLLTHENRLKHCDDLWIDCAGDEFSPDAVGKFSFAPCFYFFGGKVKFRTIWTSNAIEYYGSASGFSPQN